MNPLRSLTAVCPVALALALQGVAFAAEPSSNSDNDNGNELALQEVTVTGSRIVVRDGYTAPTPVTVVSSEAILSGSPTANVSQYLNTMPVFAGSSTPQTNVGSTQSGNTRVNGLNLRRLGTVRTLLLVDGQRVVSSTQDGTSDLNSIPQQLIQRVDIVTGGASAVYGSDAVAGVVNVILDKGFNGIKAEVGAGITGYGDNPNGNIQFSAGTPFAGGRGHALFSSEYNYAEGINGDGGRQWNRQAAIVVSNPLYTATSGLPQFLNARGVGFATGSLGGLIFSGPLRGVAFGPGGQPYQYQFGSVVSGQYMIGGEWQANDLRSLAPLENREERQNYLGRVDFDLTDTIKVFVQASWANAHLQSDANKAFMLGNGPTIQIDNPYIPASVRARMVALNLTSFRIGTESIDLPILHADLERSVKRYTAGLSGKFDALGNEWSWETTYLWNASTSRTLAFNNVIKDKYALATDAVVHPVTGAIVCRSTLTDPTNGCSPFNPLGIGVASQAAINYVTGTSFQNLVQEQEVFEASVSGTLFNNWAGAVSLAGNIAHRKESAHTDLNTLGAPFLFGNTGAVAGSYNVNEAALETLFPLIGGGDFIQSWDISAAARLTDYSTSGKVTTWKLGSSFASTKGFRVRGTLSRDIRAPGLNELFAGGTISNTGGGTFDPFTNTTVPTVTETRGNASLTPEIATSKSVGVVVSPTFMPGFQASVDYWEVSIKDAITTVGAGNVLNLCYQGQTAFCSSIERNSAGVLQKIIGAPFNYAEQRTRGVDLDVSYSPELENLIGGRLDLRANATFYLEGYSNNGLTPATDNVGVTDGLPKWRVSTTATYTRNAVRGSLTARAFPHGLIATGAIECQTGCPASTPDKPTYDKAWLPGAFYLDGSFGYTFGKDGDRSWEAFFNVRNILDRDPPPVSVLIYQPNTQVGVYDYLGRQFRIGVRARL
ncbi:MAG: TonB-dependent receptor [Steroidobacteraceae bacterium]